jgi:16S rRNA (adenine1518-N6/adenine1519-N6)-dimethyltransferase
MRVKKRSTFSIASEVKKTFRELGLAPKKWMGQNLLVDPLTLNRIVDAADIESGQAVVEIGAGLGALTAALVDRGAEVWALEIDAGFFRALEQKLGQAPRVRLVHADALDYDFRSLAAQLGRLRVVANLPYSVSSRLIFQFCEHRDVFGALTALLQKEVAERLIASPGTRDYGVLTVMLALNATVELLFDVPPRAFYPVPEVTSTLVRITFPDQPPIEVSDRALAARLVKACFAARRKTLRNNLKASPVAGVPGELILDAACDAGIDLSRRAETLAAEEFAKLTDFVVARKKAG